MPVRLSCTGIYYLLLLLMDPLAQTPDRKDLACVESGGVTRDYVFWDAYYIGNKSHHNVRRGTPNDSCLDLHSPVEVQLQIPSRQRREAAELPRW